MSGPDTPPVPAFIGDHHSHSPESVTCSCIWRLSSPRCPCCQHVGQDASSASVFWAEFAGPVLVASVFPPVSGQGSQFSLQIGPIIIISLLANPEPLDLAPVTPTSLSSKHKIKSVRDCRVCYPQSASTQTMDITGQSRGHPHVVWCQQC